MKILVTYFSQTGNTKKIAEAFFPTLAAKGHQVDLHELKKIESESLKDYDLVFVGSTCHSADIAKPVIDLLEGINGDAKFGLAGFVTHSTKMDTGSELDHEMYERWAGKCEGTFHRICEEKGVSFLGYFHCQGAPNPPIADFIHKEIIPDEAEFQEYLNQVMQHPDAQDLQNAKDFAKKVLSNL